MPYSNQYLPFGVATGANVLGNNSYNSLAARLTGFQSGVALSQQVNTPLRQSTAVASMIGAFIAAYGGDALDNGDLSTLRANFEAALAHIVSVNLPAEQDLSGYLQKSGGTMTGLLKAPAGHQTAARILSASTTLTTADAGKFVEITATSTVTTSLPTPVGNGGVYFTLWANSVSAQTIRTAVAGAFQGPGSSGGTTMSLPPGAVVSVFSDGYNWIVGSYQVVPTSGLPKLTIVTATQSWTPSAGTTDVFVIATGAGGAGGGDGPTTTFKAGAGGGSGATCMSLLSAEDLSTPVTVRIAAGGVGAANADGGDGGGNTSFGSLVVAGPGRGGKAAVTNTAVMGGAGGTAIAGQIKCRGNSGLPNVFSGAGESRAGSGAASFLGGGGIGGSNLDAVDAQAGQNGSGGGGADSSPGETIAGADGGDGVVIILER